MNILTGWLSTIALVVTMASPQLTQAQTRTCPERLSECETLIDLGNNVIVQQMDLIHMQSDQIEALKFNYGEVKEALASQQVWYRQPEFLIPVSFIAGAVVMSQVSR